MGTTALLVLAMAGFGPEGWTLWSARQEIAPQGAIDPLVTRADGPGSLRLSGASNAAEHGGWHKRVDGIRPGQWYRFAAWYRARGVASENWQIVARVEWQNAKGERAGQPEYAFLTKREGEWTELKVDAPAPESAGSAVLQLYMSNAAQGTVWWDDATLQEITAPPRREVAVASINLRPDKTGSAAESVRQFLETVAKSVPGKVDLIVLPEGITVVGTGKTYAEVSEPVPGPTTARLGELARTRKSWVVAGIYEREGNAIYNTAVLLDREGRLSGKYRKVYLPREEVERGLTPGTEYPVFQTDFGRLGMMICYDVFFSDPARALALQGAEIIAMPIWGGDETLAKARAIEGSLFLVASGYDHPTYIMDPRGERIAQATSRGTAAIATVDLNRRYTDEWLGDMRARRVKEIRHDVESPKLPGMPASQ